MSNPHKLNPFALKHMLKKRDDDVQALRDCLRFAIKLAEDAVGGYDPKHYPALKEGLATCRFILKETKKPTKRK